jgi:hypothetical protein
MKIWSLAPRRKHPVRPVSGKIRVTALDLMWFGNFLMPRLVSPSSATRERSERSYHRCDHPLASVANDPAATDPKLTWRLAPPPLRLPTAVLARRASSTSSGSAHGQAEAQVTEDLELEPLSEYKFQDTASIPAQLAIWRFNCPATVCGFSPRMRLDVRSTC